MATIFALSLVPVQAFAEQAKGDIENTTSTSPVMNRGTITIHGPKKGETYDVWRMFELASFDDDDTTPGVHIVKDTAANTIDTNEHYSYVIHESSPWYVWLKGSPSGDPYAVEKPTDWTESTSAGTNQLFWIEKEAVTLKDDAGLTYPGYHVVTATSRFSNAWDVHTQDRVNTNPANTGTFDYAKQDYVEPGANKASVTTVQNFAQEAVKWARDGDGKALLEGDATVDPVVHAYANPFGTHHWNQVSADGSDIAVENAPLGYYLMGTTMGTLASLDTNNTNVTVYEKNQEPTLEKKVLGKGFQTGAETVEQLTQLTKEYRQRLIEDATGRITAADAIINRVGIDTAGEEYQNAVSDKAAAQNDLQTATDLEVHWVDNTDADLKDFVQYRTVVTARQGAKNYVIHDVMEPGLTLVNSRAQAGETADDRYTLPTGVGQGDHTIKVYLVRGGTGSDAGVYYVHGNATNATDGWYLNYQLLTENENIPGRIATATADHCDFEIKIVDANTENATEDFNSQDKVTLQAIKVSGHENRGASAGYEMVDVKDGDQIVVTYWAQLNDDAVIWGDTEEDKGSGNGAEVSNVKCAGDTDASSLTAQKSYTANGDGRNTNHAVLTYGNKSFTDWDSVTVTPYQLEIAKTSNDKTGTTTDTQNLLAGAQFSLYKAKEFVKEETTTAVPQAANGKTQFVPATGKDTLADMAVSGKGYYVTSKALLFTREDTSTSEPPATTPHSIYHYKGDIDTENAGTLTDPVTNVIESLGTEAINVHGLEEGWYMLVEDKAPTGYNRLAHPIMIYVNGDNDSDWSTTYENEGKLDVAGMDNKGLSGNDANTIDKTKAAWKVTLDTTDTTQYVSGGVQVINQTGAELPSTGGIGTTIFYVAGTVLVVGAVVMLVAKRRMGTEA